MHSLKGVFFEAWSRIKPILDANPAELQVRLARRSNALLTRPFREWCITLRSSDRRITPWKIAITPDNALADLLPHTVTITKSVLQRLCRPIAIEPFTDLPDAADQLGVSTTTIRKAIRRGQFRLHQHRRWRRTPAHGRCCRNYPELASDHLFNPTADWKLQSPDPVWGDRWTLFPDDLPDAFRQTLHRIPLWLPAGPNPTGTRRHDASTQSQITKRKSQIE